MEKVVEKLFEPVLFMKSDLDFCAYSIYLTCESGDYARSWFSDDGLIVKLGVVCEWEELVPNLLHELQESYLFKEGKRFSNTKEPREYSTINCVFIVDHTEFQLMCRAIGIDIAKMIFKLHDAWQELNKEYDEKLKKKEKKTKSSVKKQK